MIPLRPDNSALSLARAALLMGGRLRHRGVEADRGTNDTSLSTSLAAPNKPRCSFLPCQQRVAYWYRHEVLLLRSRDTEGNS